MLFDEQRQDLNSGLQTPNPVLFFFLLHCPVLVPCINKSCCFKRRGTALHETIIGWLGHVPSCDTSSEFLEGEGWLKIYSILLMNIVFHFLHLLPFSVIYEPDFNSAELIAKELYRAFQKSWLLSDVNQQPAGPLNAAGSVVSIQINWPCIESS